MTEQRKHFMGGRRGGFGRKRVRVLFPIGCHRPPSSPWVSLPYHHTAVPPYRRTYARTYQQVAAAAGG